MSLLTMKISRIFLSLFFSLVVAVATAQVGMDSLKRELQREIKSYPATVGVALIVNGRDTLALNNEVQYPMMSVFKFHQALAVADYLQRNQMSFDTPLAVQKADLKENTYSPLRDKYPQGGVTKTVTACTTGTARLPYPLQGTEAVLGHKTGTGDRNERGEYIGINDIGFVLLPGGNRYVIAVLVKDSRASYEETEAMIGRVSEIVYKYIKHLF